MKEETFLEERNFNRKKGQSHSFKSSLDCWCSLRGTEQQTSSKRAVSTSKIFILSKFMGGFVVVGICRICRNGQRVRPRQLDDAIDFTWLKSSEESSTPSVILRSHAIQILIGFVSMKKFWESYCVFNDYCGSFWRAAKYFVVKSVHELHELHHLKIENSS